VRFELERSQWAPRSCPTAWEELLKRLTRVWYVSKSYRVRKPHLQKHWLGGFLKNLLWSFVNHHAPQSHSAPPPFYLLSTLASSPSPKKKKSHCESCSVSQGVPQNIPLSTLLCLQMFITMTCHLMRGLWLLLLYQYWNFTGRLLRYPVVALCHGDSALQHFIQLGWANSNSWLWN